ncbi:hypothetical protein NL676_024164 [Syzygium grande]|nr:hypothetical protein NL676_024164 [Syzygium grande]
MGEIWEEARAEETAGGGDRVRRAPRCAPPGEPRRDTSGRPLDGASFLGGAAFYGNAPAPPLFCPSSPCTAGPTWTWTWGRRATAAMGRDARLTLTSPRGGGVGAAGGIDTCPGRGREGSTRVGGRDPGGGGPRAPPSFPAQGNKTTR